MSTLTIPSPPPARTSAGGPDDVREALRAAAAEPGGNRTPIAFTSAQRDLLDIIVDELVPPGAGFPAPSDVDVVEQFFTRYIAPAGSPTVHFPGAAEAEFKSTLDELAPSFNGLDRPGRVALLSRLEIERPEFFGQLRALTYAGYYSRPAVVIAMRANLEAARDYHGPPLPYGYERTTRDWSGVNPPQEGTYVSTEDVRPTAPRAD